MFATPLTTTPLDRDDWDIVTREKELIDAFIEKKEPPLTYSLPPDVSATAAVTLRNHYNRRWVVDLHLKHQSSSLIFRTKKLTQELQCKTTEPPPPRVKST